MKTHTVTFSAAALTLLAACDSAPLRHASPAAALAPGTHVARFGSDGAELRVGVVYALDRQERLGQALDLVSNNIVGKGTGVLGASQGAGELGLIALGHVAAGDREGACAPGSRWAKITPERFCGPPSKVTLDLKPALIQRERMADPMLFLELINRPTSGLIYNQAAEMRVMQWRTALAGAASGGRTYLCTDTATMRDGEVIVRGKIDALRAAALVRDMNKTGVFHVDYGKPASSEIAGMAEYRFPVAGSLQLEAVMREITFVDTSTAPRIDFSLAGRRTWSLVTAKP